MAVTRKPAPAPDNTTTALANWDAELAKFAKEASDVEKVSGNFISLKSGILQINGLVIEGNKMQVIILDSVFENQYYEGAYDANNPSTPKCFAFGHTEEELAPKAEDVTEVQSETCVICPQNQWGTALQGKGKACKNVKRLCVISNNGLTPEKVAEAEKYYLKVSVTNVKGWAQYVKTVAATLGRPPFGVVTEIGVVPDPKSQFKITFKPVENLGPEFMAAIMAKREEAVNEIMFPYAKFVPPPEGTPAPAAKPQKRKF